MSTPPDEPLAARRRRTWIPAPALAAGLTLALAGSSGQSTTATAAVAAATQKVDAICPGAAS
jgi:hypothetical protein